MCIIQNMHYHYIFEKIRTYKINVNCKIGNDNRKYENKIIDTEHEVRRLTFITCWKDQEHQCRENHDLELKFWFKTFINFDKLYSDGIYIILLFLTSHFFKFWNHNDKAQKWEARI